MNGLSYKYNTFYTKLYQFMYELSFNYNQLYFNIVLSYQDPLKTQLNVTVTKEKYLVKTQAASILLTNIIYNSIRQIEKNG